MKYAASINEQVANEPLVHLKPPKNKAGLYKTAWAK